MLSDPREGALSRRALTTPRSVSPFTLLAAGLALGIGGLAGITTPAHAAGTFYVDGNNPACSDVGPGSDPQPHCTIGAALTQHPGPDVTILVRSGVYREQVTPTSSGTSSQPVVIRALGAAVIDGADDFSATGLWTPHAGNVHRAASVTWAPNQVFLDGARLTASTSAPESLAAGSFRYVAGAGLYVNAGGGNPGTHALMVGRRAFGFRLSGVSWVSIEGFAVRRSDDRGFYLSSSANNVTVLNNEASEAFHSGINVMNCSSVRLADNRCFGNLDHGIALSSVTGGTIENNECRDNVKPASLVASGIYLLGSSSNVLRGNRSHHNDGSGVYLQNASNQNLLIQNRAWANSQHGFDLFASIDTRHLGDLAWGNAREGFTVRGTSTGARLNNAIAAQNGAGAGGYQLSVESNSVSGFASNDNLIWVSTSQAVVRFGAATHTTVAAFAAATGNDTRSFQEDPRLANPAAGDFHLLASSRAIDSGNSSLADWPALDAEGRTRIDDPATANTGLGPVAYADRGPLEYTPPPSNFAPNATIDSPDHDVTITAGQGIVLRATGTDPDGDLPLSYAWNMGGGAPNSTLEDPGLVTFANPGTFAVLLTVTDSRGLADPTPASRVITVRPVPPPSGNDEIHWTVTGMNSVTLSWRGTSNMVRYGVTSSYGRVAYGQAPVPYPASSAGPFWEARLTGLHANTLYHYAIGTGADHTFRTAPLAGTSDFVAMAEADIGTVNKYPQVGPVQSLVAAFAPDLCLLPGDLTYGNDHGQVAVDNHFNDMMTWSQDAPYMPTWGNHEVEGDSMSNYKGRFDLPNSRVSPGASDTFGEDWYWFDYGNVRFIAYPEPLPGAWADWRTQVGPIMDAAQADPNIRFIVTFGHRPTYSSGNHSGSTTLANYMAALASTHSKFVLNVMGHSHNYERTYPQSGVTHVTVGTGGGTLQTFSGPNGCMWEGGCPPPAWSAFRALRYGPLRIHFTASGIRGEQICGPPGTPSHPHDIECTPGQVIDTFVIGAPDRSPVIVAPAVAEVLRGTTLTVPVTAADPDGQAITNLTADLSELPPGTGASFTSSPDGTSGTLSWTPRTIDGPRTWFVTLRATNAATAAVTLPIRVTGPDTPPVVVAPDTVTVAEGATVVVPVSASDPDYDQDVETLTANLAALPAGHGATFVRSLNGASGTLSWTPDFDDGGSNYSVTFTAGNTASGSKTTVIRVTNVNRAPVVSAPALVYAAPGVPVTVNVTASDPDGDAITSLIAHHSVLPPPAASFTPGAGNQSGTLSWTPAANAPDGSYAVRFVASNGLSGADTTVIQVTHGNQRPDVTFTIDPMDGVAPLQVTIDASGSSDPDGEGLVYRFDFGDGTVIGATSAAVQTHTYGPGVWTVRVRGTDPRGAADSLQGSFVVATNLVANPSFETSLTGWNANGGGTLARVMGAGADGGWFVTVTSPTPQATFGINDSPNCVALTTGPMVRYRFSAWVRSAGTARCKLRIREYASGLQVGATTYSPEITLTSAWQMLVADHVAAQGGSSLDLQVLDSPQGPGETFDVDNIGIREIGTGAPADAPDAVRPTRLEASARPNPIRSGGVLRFTVTRSGPVTVGIYDLQGRLARRVLDITELEPGEYSARFDGTRDGGGALEAGVYFYRVDTAGGSVSGRLVFMR